VIEKLVECSDDQLKDIVVRQLEERKLIRCLHVGNCGVILVRLFRFGVRDEGYGFKAVMYY